MLKRAFFFIVVALLLLAGCGEPPDQSLSKNSCIEIIYPTDGAGLPSGETPVVVSLSESLIEPSVSVDSKPVRVPFRRDSVSGLGIFILNLTPGTHTISVSAMGQDRKRVPEAMKKAKTPEELEKALKMIPYQKFSIEITLKITSDKSAFKFYRTGFIGAVQRFPQLPVFRFIPPDSEGFVAWGKESILVRTSRGKSLLYWVLPGQDIKRAEEIFNTAPSHLKVTFDNKNTTFLSESSCSGKQDSYLVFEEKKLKSGYGFVYHILDERGKKKEISIPEKKAIERIFTKGLNPWGLQEEELKRYIALRPFENVPLQCSSGLITQEVYLHCFWIKCKPSQVPFHMVVNSDGSFEILKSRNPSPEDLHWKGTEIILPLEDKRWIALDLSDGSYRLSGSKRSYPMPFGEFLVRDASRQYYIQRESFGYVVKPTMAVFELERFLSGKRGLFSLYKLHPGRTSVLEVNLFRPSESGIDRLNLVYEIQANN